MIIRKIATPKDLESLDFDNAVEVEFMGSNLGIFHGRFGSTGFITVEQLITHPKPEIAKVKYDWTPKGQLHRVCAPDYSLSESEKTRYNMLLRDLLEENAQLMLD
jgi:hypothetical protein